MQHFGPALGDRACLVCFNTDGENDDMGTTCCVLTGGEGFGLFLGLCGGGPAVEQ